MMMRGAFESQPGFGGEATQVVSNWFFCCRKNASPRKNTKFSDFTLLTVRQNSIYIDRRGPPCR